MTNAEKYLKDDIVVRNLTNDLVKYCCKIGMADGFTSRKLEAFFGEQAKPQLTEDEKVILRNIKHRFDKIKRLKSGLLVVEYQGLTRADINIFDKLFQFIKERRRILY